MSMIELAKKYFDQIKVDRTDFIPIDDCAVDCDAAELVLEIPRAMLREYSRIKTGTNRYPDPAEFWKETGLADLLRGSDKKIGWHCYAKVPLDDALDYLRGSELFVEYQGSHDPKTKLLSVFEVLPKIDA